MFRTIFGLTLFIHQATAIQCVLHAPYFISKNTTCEGDLCFHVDEGWARGCMSGMKYLKEGFYYANAYEYPNITSLLIKLCKTDFCNEYTNEVTYNPENQTLTGNFTIPVTIYPAIDCNYYGYETTSPPSSENWIPEGNHVHQDQFCSVGGLYYPATKIYTVDYKSFSDYMYGFFGIHPSGYATYGVIYPFYFGGYYLIQDSSHYIVVNMVCNWPLCNSFEYFPVLSNDTQCLMGRASDTPTRCSGQYCFIVTYKDSNSTYNHGGCLTQDDRKAAGRVEVGEYEFDDKIYLICAENDCNRDWETAKASIDRYRPVLEEFVPYQPPSREGNEATEQQMATTTGSEIPVDTADTRTTRSAGEETTTASSLHGFDTSSLFDGSETTVASSGTDLTDGFENITAPFGTDSSSGFLVGSVTTPPAGVDSTDSSVMTPLSDRTPSSDLTSMTLPTATDSIESSNEPTTTRKTVNTGRKVSAKPPDVVDGISYLSSIFSSIVFSIG